jgi:hypothetical protein
MERTLSADPAVRLAQAVRFGSPLQQLLLDYTRVFLAVISQSGACSQHHSIEQRVARWLLAMSRGRMNVVNKPGLREKSCECYGFIRQQYRNLQAAVRPVHIL